MPPSTWTINNAGGGSSGRDLIGCHIKQNNSGGYDFTEPNNSLLASSTGVSLPLRFTFRFHNLDWILTVETLGPGASGKWENNKPEPEREKGSWSAGAGVAADPQSKAAPENY